MSRARTSPPSLPRLLRAAWQFFSTNQELRRLRQSGRTVDRPAEAEFQRRLPVWIALSDFFLDTYSSVFYVHVARVWHDSGFSREQLRGMLFEDVAPRFYSNLTAVGGVWDGFDDSTVELLMRRQMRSAACGKAKRVDWFFRKDILDYLEKVWTLLQPYLDTAEQGVEFSTFVPEQERSTDSA